MSDLDSGPDALHPSPRVPGWKERAPAGLGHRALPLLGLAAVFAGPSCTRPAPPPEAGRVGDIAPEPPPGVLGQLTLGPLPQASARLMAFGRALGAWETDEDFLFPELRALAEGLSDLGTSLDWSRPTHLLLLDDRRLPGWFALALPVAEPERALGRLARLCRSTTKGGAWHFQGGGNAFLPCSFHARAVPGGLVVARQAILVDALARYGHALLDPRLRTTSPGPRGTGAARLIELRAFLPALRARFGIDAKKVGEWVDLAAVAIAMASGDFTAAGDLKGDLQRLVAQLDSLADVGLSVELGGDGLDLCLFATGRPGGTLARWTRERRPAPLGLHRRLEPTAALSMAFAGPGRTAPIGARAFAGGEHREVAGAATSAATDAAPRPALAPLAELLLQRLPEAFRGPARRLWSALTGPGSGELAFALRHDGGGELGLELLLVHGQAQGARRELFEASLALIGALRGGLGSAAPVEAHRGQDVDHFDLGIGFGEGALQAAFRLLFGSAPLSLAVSHRGNAVALVLGTRAQDRAQALLTGPDPPARHPARRASESGADVAAVPSCSALPPPGQGALGRVTLSLLELGRLVPGLIGPDAISAPQVGALLLHWGVAPSLGRVEILISLSAAHLKAAAPLLQALSDRLESSADSFSGFLGADQEPEDAL